jgi:hypothetical protein
MLMLDGHGSHQSVQFEAYCKDHNIVPIYLTPHSFQRCHYMTRVAGREDPHPTRTTLILILHAPPSCYASTYTCRRQRTGHIPRV